MKLRVSLRTPGSADTRNIQVTADATATVHDVAKALAGALGHEQIPENLTLRTQGGVSGQARTVPAATMLIDSGVQSGAVLDLTSDDVSASGRRAEPAALLRIVGGQMAGVEVQLPFGSSEIGREPNCDVHLTDPRVSKRHARVLVSPDKIEIIDNNSSNGVLLGGARTGRAAITPEDVVVVGDTAFTVMPLRVHAEWGTSDVAFVRSPRVLARPEVQEVPLPEPPGPVDRPKFPLLVMLAPLIMGAGMFLVTRSMLSIIFVALSPLMMIGTWASSRADLKARQKAAIANFEKAFTVAVERVTELQNVELQQWLALHPSVNECVQAVSTQSDLIWSRRPEMPEYLQFRLGLGLVQSQLKPDVKAERGLPEYSSRVLQLAEASRWLADAPIIADLRSVGSIGICGRRELADGLARAAVVQLASLHSPAETIICCLTSAGRRDSWHWVEWLPHTNSPHSPLSLHLAADSAASRGLTDQLEDLVASRLADKQSSQALVRGPVTEREPAPAPVLPSVVVIVDQPQIDRGRITRLAEQGPDAGVHFIWVAESKNDLPAACRTYLDAGRGAEPSIGQVRSGAISGNVACESVDQRTAEAIGRRFAPLIDAGAPIDDESDLPRMVSVVGLLGKAESDNPEVVVERWRENRSLVPRDGRPAEKAEHPVELRAIVGHSGLEPFVIDMRRDGPHALVGGTTGAGKSEFLQAWVLGLAHALSPDRVNFLFVDYKGGTAFAKCVELPHCVGLVTDLNPYLVRRVLTSLRAELKRREHILNDKGKKDLIDLELSGDPECPPSLIIVVDEFAALAGEIPEFVDGMVDIAQRGRSLGLHLILATQRPAGVIKDNLRANTNLRIALRMADEQDSTDVLGSPMAAFFSSSIPGRGAAKSGPGRIVTFQSAYPGARTADEPLMPPIEVTELNFSSGQPWQVPTPLVATTDVAKDIERVVGTIKLAAENAKIPVPRRPWLNELQPIYNLMKLGQRRDTEIVLGVLDDPERQSQDVEYFRPEEAGNILYVGAGGSGKTTALRSLAIAASITPRSGPVHIYGLDFGGGGLSFLEPLPNTGSIISGDDDERVARLIRYLSAVVEERSARYSAARASSLVEYRELSGKADEPRLLLLLDGFASFRETYEISNISLYTAFTRLLVDGRAVGLNVAITADRPSALPTSITAAFPQRIVLRQADDEAYALLGVPKDVLGPLSAPGRGMQIDKPQELQIAILGDDVATAAQARLIDEMARAFEQYHVLRPAPIKALPAVIPAAEMPSSVRGQPVLGVADINLAPIGFEPSSMIMITGPDGSGKTSAVQWLATSIRASGRPIELVHYAFGRSPLASSKIWTRSAVGEEAVMADIEVLKAQVSVPADGSSVALFVESLPDALSGAAEYPLTELLQTCRKNGHVVVAEGDMAAWSGHWPLLQEVRNQRCGLLLQPEQMDGDTILRTSLPRCKRTDFPVGRGFWVKGGAAIKVQIPVVD